MTRFAFIWALIAGLGFAQYSPLRQIHRQNVKKLKVAWTYDSGDAYPGSEMQARPLFVKGVIYTTTPSLKVVAIDAGTGQELWKYDGLGGKRPTHKNRGVTYWTDGKLERVFVTLGVRLISLDAKTGKPDEAFGEKGEVDMRDAFEMPREKVQLTVTSPGVVFQDVLILGSSVPENLPSTPGDIRAYDTRTGKLRWVFRTIPKAGEEGSETWPAGARERSGGANNWVGMVVDEKRGYVYVPTGSAAFDFYGADRHGDNLYANTLLCLDALTGEKKWHFQAIRHDVWDLDFPQAPVLVRVRRDGRMVDAVAQAGKDGFVWVLNRDTGESLFPLETRKIPASPVEGEKLAETQVVPTKPAPFSRQKFSEDLVTDRTPEARAAVLERLKGLDYGDRFTPPSTRGTVVYPGFSGGAEWGGSTFDPETRMLYINANEMPWVLRLVPPEKMRRVEKASRIYQSRCASCHGLEGKGAPPEYPAVTNLGPKYTKAQLTEFVANGGGRMPGFGNLGPLALEALSDWLLTKEDREAPIGRNAAVPPMLKYTMDGYNKFLDPDGYPAVKPPWGTLNAIALDTGEYVWKTPLGEYPELRKQGLPITGTENHGGAVVTAGGLLFIGATPYDKKLRAFDKITGQLLWETELPYACNATPVTYLWKGRQYVMAPAGGGRGRESGAKFVAFTLP